MTFTATQWITKKRPSEGAAGVVGGAAGVGTVGGDRGDGVNVVKDGGTNSNSNDPPHPVVRKTPTSFNSGVDGSIGFIKKRKPTLLSRKG